MITSCGSVYAFSQEGSILHPTVEKLYSFKNLEEGWHYGEGVPVDEEFIEKAIELYNEASKNDFFETDVFPGLSGEVRLTIYYEKHYFEFTIETNMLVTFVHEKDDKEISYEENLSFEESKSKIATFKEQICDTTASFTGIYMTQEKKDFKVPLLKTPVMAQGFQLSEKGAYYCIMGTQSADILGNTIKELQVNPQFFGSFRAQYYPEEAI